MSSRSSGAASWLDSVLYDGAPTTTESRLERVHLGDQADTDEAETNDYPDTAPA
jgi:hypothetical protein